MRKTVLMALVVLVVAAACSDDDGATTRATQPVERPGLTFDRSACPDPIEVTDAAGLLDVLAAVPWDWVGPSSSGSEPVSGDLVVVGTITIGGADVPVPAECLDRGDCRDVAIFSANADGASTEGSDDWFVGDPSLTLTDTTVRLGAALIDTHPGPYNFVPVVSAFGPCGEPCGSGQFACQADLTCYHGYDTYCRRCEGRPVEECACRDVDGPLDDGNPCDFFVSGDVIESGFCRSGRCER